MGVLASFLKTLSAMTETVAEVVVNIVAVLVPIVVFEIFWWPVGKFFYKKPIEKTKQTKPKRASKPEQKPDK